MLFHFHKLFCPKYAWNKTGSSSKQQINYRPINCLTKLYRFMLGICQIFATECKSKQQSVTSKTITWQNYSKSFEINWPWFRGHGQIITIGSEMCQYNCVSNIIDLILSQTNTFLTPTLKQQATVFLFLLCRGHTKTYIIPSFS